MQRLVCDARLEVAIVIAMCAVMQFRNVKLKSNSEIDKSLPPQANAGSIWQDGLDDKYKDIDRPV